MKELSLSAGRVALVDDEDFDRLSQRKWSFNGRYAARNERGRTIFMHREILGVTPEQLVDHINGDRLDNRKANLRVCTSRQNSRNQRKTVIPTTSQYKGVSLHKKSQRWVATIRDDKTTTALGYYETEVEAAQAYDFAAHQLFGEFAQLNFPNQTPTQPSARVHQLETKARTREFYRRLRDGESPELLAKEFNRTLSTALSKRSKIRAGLIKVED